MTSFEILKFSFHLKRKEVPWLPINTPTSEPTSLEKCRGRREINKSRRKNGREELNLKKKKIKGDCGKEKI